MITIPYDQFRERISAVFAVAQFPKLPRALNVVIVSREFFANEWRKFWAVYRQGRGLIGFNAGICNLITKTAENEFDWLINRHAADSQLGEVAGGMIEARVFIAAGQFLNGIGRPEGVGHSTAIVGLTEDNKTWEPYFWEPQEKHNDPLQLTTLEDAYHAYIGLFDALD